jgi:hypothetical protein
MTSKHSKILCIAISLLCTTAFAANETSCEHGGACPGQVGNGGNGGSGGNGGLGGNSTSSAGAIGIGIANSVSGATSGSHSSATSGDSSANGGSASAVAGSATAGNGSVSNAVTTGNVRSLSLGAASVGAPAADTCVAYVAVGFGLITAPIQLKSCIAAQQALLLDHFGLRDAAIARLCQEQEIADTGICPAKKKEIVSQFDSANHD